MPHHIINTVTGEKHHQEEKKKKKKSLSTRWMGWDGGPMSQLRRSCTVIGQNATSNLRQPGGTLAMGAGGLGGGFAGNNIPRPSTSRVQVRCTFIPSQKYQRSSSTHRRLSSSAETRRSYKYLSTYMTVDHHNSPTPIPNTQYPKSQTLPVTERACKQHSAGYTMPSN